MNNKKAQIPKPKGAQAFIDGSFYKIGLHGKPYRYDGEEWVRSEKRKCDVLKCIEVQAIYFTPSLTVSVDVTFLRSTG